MTLQQQRDIDELKEVVVGLKSDFDRALLIHSNLETRFSMVIEDNRRTRIRHDWAELVYILILSLGGAFIGAWLYDYLLRVAA